MTKLRPPMNLKTEYTVNPLGVDVPQPRLFWQLHDSRRGTKQSAYQIRAGSQPGGDDLWDTGKITSPDCIHISYQGPTLESAQRVYWQVRTWDAQDIATPYSEPAWFERGLLEDSNWQGQWITSRQQERPIPGPAIYLRKSFDLPAKIRSARLYITARGV